MFYSPLRYPGGKGKLTEFMKYMIDQLGHSGGTYIEPFAGGAGIAIELLLRGVVSRIVINDYDKGIWSFWKAVLTETDRFIAELAVVPLTMEEWNRQRNICLTRNDKYSFELGFATFYMNRTNHSGIIKGGVIGGMDQSGLWKMDARFKREELIRRIESIAERKSGIKLYNKDINSFITRYIPLYEENTLVYFDPPYRPITDTASFTAYTENLFNDEAQIGLAKFVDEMHEKGAKIVISNSDPKNTNAEDEFFDNIYSSHKIKRVEATRMINRNSEARGKITELLISNF